MVPSFHISDHYSISSSCLVAFNLVTILQTLQTLSGSKLPKKTFKENSSNINQLQHGPPATKRTPLALGGMSRRSGEKSLWTAGTSVNPKQRCFWGESKLIENGRYMCIYI